MTVHFPKLQNDETFYSGCAQLQDRLPHHNGERLRKELFDIGTKKDITRIPSRLKIFIDRLGDHINLSAQEVIEKHTIFPFLSFPLLRARSETLLSAMLGDPMSTSEVRLQGSSTISRCLRYCPLCVEDDRRLTGAAYWHRVHQIDAFQICPVHRCFVVDSPVVRGGTTQSRFVSAESSVPITRIVILANPSDSWHQLQIWLGDQCLWLLEHGCLSVDAALLPHVYRQGLSEKFGLPSDARSLKSFIKECDQMYPATWLTMMRCGQLNKRTNWIHKAVTRGDRDTIKHLLIIRALGYDLQQICKSLKEASVAPLADHVSWSINALTPMKVTRRDSHRAALLRIMGHNPSASRNQLRHSLATAEISYLGRYDRAWLDSVLPAKQSRGPSRGRMRADWASRDREMSEKVAGIREIMLATSQRPKRLTRSRLLARLGPRVLPPGKLPLTDRAVKNATESDLEFAIRRLYWFASDTESIGRPRYFSTLLFRAGIRREWRGLPVVIEAVERAAELFQRTECDGAWLVAA